MSAKPVFLIVGASLAGAKAAEELRTFLKRVATADFG